MDIKDPFLQQIMAGKNEITINMLQRAEKLRREQFIKVLQQEALKEIPQNNRNNLQALAQQQGLGDFYQRQLHVDNPNLGGTILGNVFDYLFK